MRLTIDSHYLFTKRNVFYFSRRIPDDLRGHYTSSRIVLSLKTKSRRVAQTKAISLATKLEEDWLTLRWRSSSDPLRRFLNKPVAQNDKQMASSAPGIVEAKELYLRLKGEGRSITFTQAAKRTVEFVVQTVGDKPIDAYTRKEVNGLRDEMQRRGLSKSSVRRNFTTIKAIVNFTARELGLPDLKAFSAVYLGDDLSGEVSKRVPVPTKDILNVQSNCRSIDDEARWLVALISDTGMRLSEAAGLIVSDLVLDTDHPHIALIAHPWRRLKTTGSERLIPLAGAALWAARRAAELSQGGFLFPKYCNEDKCKSNSASGALNKWLSPRITEGCVVHSFRHSMRDRLRAVECPPDIIDRIGGWSVGGIGETYGSGYPIGILHKWISKAVEG